MAAKKTAVVDPNAFIGLTAAPSAAELAAALGATLTVWSQLVTELAVAHGVDIREWHSYSPKAGWALRLKRENRSIVYLSPCRGWFRVSFALGPRAVEAARRSDLPGEIIDLINDSPQYAEGTGVRLDVRGARDIPVVRKLAALKIQF